MTPPRFCHVGCRLLLCAVGSLIWVGALRADEPPPAVGVGFKNSAFVKTKLARTGDTKFLTGVVLGGGTITADAEPGWQIRAGVPFGDGTLDFLLDRAQLPGDLALALRVDWGGEADVAIRLLDAAGKPVAADLFGNVANDNHTEVATDTFLIPLTRYPQATRLSVRRLRGEFTVQRAGVFPVASGEIPAAPAARLALAVELGLVPAETGVPSATTETKMASALFGPLHVNPPLAQVNAVGAAVLAQPGYPIYHRLTAGTLEPVEMANSGTTEEFFRAAQRFLSVEAMSALKKSLFTSSDGVAEYLLSNRVRFGLMSVPLTDKQKDEFRQQHGFPILEFVVAHDAIEVLVNAKNPLTELTLPQLESIYSNAPRGGGHETAKNWREVGGSDAEIQVYGGYPGWGTSKAFASLVMSGEGFRPDMKMQDVVYREGIESAVAENEAAIGYVALRPRESDVRVLALAAKPGDKAFPPEAAAIYGGQYPLQRSLYGYLACEKLDAAAPLERELVNLLLSDAGQAMVTRGGSLPLSAPEVTAARARLGLPP